jgi:hypothetical protein
MKPLQSQILKYLIQLSGINQKQFAEKHELHVGYLSEVINQKSEYRSSTLELIAFDCGYKIEYNYKLEKL